MKTIAARLALGLVLFATPLRAADCRVAVVFEQQGPEHFPDLKGALLGALRQESGLNLVEAPQVEGPLALDRAAELGKGVGAEVVALSNLKVESYRLTARLIEVQSGMVLAAPSAAGDRGEVFDLVDALSRRLADNLQSGGGKPHRLAILHFANLAAAEYAPFVRGLPDMLATNLGPARDLSLVARAEAEGALAHFALDPGPGFAAEDAAEVGAWLGADWVVVGDFTEVLRARARLVEVRSGRLLAEQSCEGGRAEMEDQLAELARGMARHLGTFRDALRKVAVLYFENHAPAEYEGFVRGLSDMLMTNLGQAEGLVVIERVQIERALQNFALELSGPIDNEKAVEIGQWLGADAVVLGGFTHFGDMFRIDARLISASTGELLVAQNVRGAEAEMMALVDQLGSGLVASLAEKETQVKGGTGELQVRFMIAKTEMGERSLYRHQCKLYVDGKFLGTSAEVKGPERWETLFTRKLRAGKHEVRVVHGYVKQGEWDGEMPLQPRVFEVVIEPGQSAAIQYSFEVGWFSDQYRYQHPWRGMPR